MVDFWLVSVVTVLVVVLDKNINFEGEKCKIKTIIWSFLTSYISWTIWNLIDVSLKNEAVFVDIVMGDLIVPSLCSFVPIFLVMYVHFRNVFTPVDSAEQTGKETPEALSPTCSLKKRRILTRKAG